MKNLLKLVVTITTIFLLSGCGDPTLDTSSDAALKESVSKIMADLSQDDQERFKKALTGVYMFGALASMGSDNPEQARAKIDEKLNGKTAEDIFQLADELKQQMNNR